MTTSLHHVAEELSEHGDRLAVMAFEREGVERWSYGELAGAMDRLAAGLAERGVEPDEPVALLAPNSPAWIVACLAIIRTGAVPVPVDVQFEGDRLEHVLSDSGARRIFTTRDRIETLLTPEGRDPLEPILLDKPDSDEPPGWRRLLAEGGAPAGERGEDDRAVLFYTSGTTGPPKGVPLSHRNLMFQIEALRESGLVSEGDRVLLPLPLHHVYPFVLGMLTPLAMGLPLVMPRSMTGQQMVRAMREGEVTAAVGVPRLYRALISGIESRVETQGRLTTAAYRRAAGLSEWARRRLKVRIGRWLLHPVHKRFGPNLRVVASGGSPLPKDLAWQLEGLGWRVATGYGLTETAPLLTWNLPGQAKFGTAGKPLPGVELKIDPSARPEGDETTEQPDGQEIGEVLARGPNVFAGYHHLSDKTTESFTDDDWYRTGDLGYLDDAGYLHVLGRVSTMIVTEGGENIQPDEVEGAYEQHPALKEVGVLQHEGKLTALVVPEPGAADEQDGNPEQAARDAVSERSRDLPSYQRVSDVAVTRQALPRTRLGKIRRHELEQRYDQARAGKEAGEPEQARPMPIEEMSGPDRKLLDDPAARQAWHWLAERYSDQRLTPDTSPQADLGVDSMAWLDLTLELGQRTGVELDEEAIERIETVRDLLEEVASATEQGDGTRPLEEPESALDERQRRWLEPLNPMQRTAARGLLAVDRLVMHGMFHLHSEGMERVPAEGAFVLASNHASHLDPFAIAAALGPQRMRRVHWGGWTGWVMHNPLYRAVGRLAQTVPVAPERAAVSSLAVGAAVLKRGEALAWFPEGERSADGHLQPFKPGLGRLLEVYPVPVVPVLVQGTHEAMPPGRLWPKAKTISVVFGDPVDPQQLEQQGEGDQSADRIMHALRERVANLADGSVRG